MLGSGGKYRENSLLETILNGVYSRPTARFFASGSNVSVIIYIKS
jgi:hypothetical protein